MDSEAADSCGSRLLARLRMGMAWIGADLNRSCLLVGAEIVSERLGRGAFAERGGRQFVFTRNQQLA